METLPEELGREILARLEDARDVAAAAAAIPSLRTAAKAQVVWKNRAKMEVGVTGNALWDGWTWRDWYQQVLWPLRGLLGWWQRNLRFYSGVVNVVAEPSGINGYAMDCPLDDTLLSTHSPLPPLLLPEAFPADRLPPRCRRSVVRAPSRPNGPCLAALPDADWSRASRHVWRPRPLFSLTHVGRKLRLYCFQSDLGVTDAIGHLPCQPQPGGGPDCVYVAKGRTLFCSTCQHTVLSCSEAGYTLNCRNESAHSHFGNVSLDTPASLFWPLEHGVRLSQNGGIVPAMHNLINLELYGLRIHKFSYLLRNLSTWRMEPLKLPPPIPPSIHEAVFQGWEEDWVPKEGLYFGSYSGHGSEIISFSYGRTASGRPCFEGLKITGDPNVPARELSVRIFLDAPLILTRDDQGMLSEVAAAIREARESDPPDTRSLPFRSQVFSLPLDLSSRRTGFEPTQCAGRFLGEGQIASTDFTNPDYTEVVLELLGPGHLGVLWTNLGIHSHYFRAGEQPPVQDSE